MGGFIGLVLMAGVALLTFDVESAVNKASENLPHTFDQLHKNLDYLEGYGTKTVVPIPVMTRAQIVALSQSDIDNMTHAQYEQLQRRNAQVGSPLNDPNPLRD